MAMFELKHNDETVFVHTRTIGVWASAYEKFVITNDGSCS